MSRPETPGPIWTSVEGSMARSTALTRWPKIVQGIIEDIQETIDGGKSQHQAEQGSNILRNLSQLLDEITSNGYLRPLGRDDSGDLTGYNSLLGSFGKISWHNCPWLFAECYLYRRVQTLISTQPAWKDYDVFARQKLASLITSKTAVEELSSKYIALSKSPVFKNADMEAAYAIFVEMTEIALWGNATDLSLLTSISPEHIEAIQGTKAIAAGRSRIVSNDIAAAWEYLTKNQGRRVDIVLDNAGFELFTDLLYSIYLLDAGLASSVQLHSKSMPWFVSDVNPHDIPVLLSTLKDKTVFGDAGAEIANRLQGLFDEGSLSIKEHPFWTTAYDFQEMPALAPQLVKELSGAALVIFKGDLNYRKLVRDATWPYSTPFKDALGILAKTGGGKGDAPDMKILVLRTNKSDVCVGVGEETVRRLEREAPRADWVRNGKYAVVNLSV